MIFAYYKSTNNSATINYYYYTSSINNIHSFKCNNNVFCCTVIYFNSQKAKTFKYTSTNDNTDYY